MNGLRDRSHTSGRLLQAVSSSITPFVYLLLLIPSLC
jgi:hypothetical protein